MFGIASLLYICFSVSFVASVSPSASTGGVPEFANTFPQNVTAGQNLLITWTGGNPTFDLDFAPQIVPLVFNPIATSLNVNSFLWPVPSSMPVAVFEIILLSSNPNYQVNSDELTLVNGDQIPISTSAAPSSSSKISQVASSPRSVASTSLGPPPAVVQTEVSTTSLVAQLTSPPQTPASPPQSTSPSITSSSAPDPPPPIIAIKHSSNTNPSLYSPIITPSAITTAQTNTPVSSASHSPTKASSSKPKGAKIGMGIGITLGVVAFVGLLALFFYFRRKYAPQTTVSKNYDFEKPELEAGEVVKTMPRLPSMGKGPYELDGTSRSIRRAELG